MSSGLNFGNKGLTTGTGTSIMGTGFQSGNVLGSGKTQTTGDNYISSINMNKRKSDEWEIVNVIQNYLSSLQPESPMNVFKYMLYNKVPAGVDVHILQNYKQFIRGEDGKDTLVDNNLWIKAIHNNPSPNTLYPFQISSPNQLVQRTKKTQVLEFHVLETIVNLQNGLNQLNDTYDNEIEKELNEAKRKIELIKAKNLSVISKIERLALSLGRAEKNFQMENTIQTGLSKLQTSLSENSEYMSKIKEVQSRSMLLSFNNQQNEDLDYLKSFEEVRMEKNINVLKEMRSVIEVTMKSLRKNNAIINGIKSDMDCVKKYGKIHK